METLRFLSLLESGKRSLSLSQVFMWVTLVLMIYTSIVRPDNTMALITAAGAQIAATGNYCHRRHYRSKEANAISDAAVAPPT